MTPPLLPCQLGSWRVLNWIAFVASIVAIPYHTSPTHSNILTFRCTSVWMDLMFLWHSSWSTCNFKGDTKGLSHSTMILPLFLQISIYFNIFLIMLVQLSQFPLCTLPFPPDIPAPPPPLSHVLGHACRLFGYSVSYTILNILLSIVYLPISAS